MPQFLQIVSYAIPLRYFLVIIRTLLLKGVGLAAIQNEVIALAIFGVVIMGAAATRFRKAVVSPQPSPSGTCPGEWKGENYAT
jgi:ABC-2 type transport system permease protein